MKHQGKVDTGYRSYNERQKLTLEQRVSILEAREKEREKSKSKNIPEKKGDKDTNGTDPPNNNRNKQRRNKKRTRRQNIAHEMEDQDTESIAPEGDDPM